MFKKAILTVDNFNLKKAFSMSFFEKHILLFIFMLMSSIFLNY